MIDLSIIEQYRHSRNRLVLLDYDGTLVGFKTDPELATPPNELVELLLKLQESPGTELVIITGRTFQSIDRFLGKTRIDIVAEHGAMIRENDTWKQHIALDTTWKTDVLNVMSDYKRLRPRSFIEHKLLSLAWHYRTLTDGEKDALDMISDLQKILIKNNLKIIQGDKVIEVISNSVGKGIATEYILKRKTYDYILSIGDDTSDEEMFEVLKNTDVAHTVKVGPGDSIAQSRVSEVKQVHQLLEEMVK